jgi:type III pantothenate kinase
MKRARSRAISGSEDTTLLFDIGNTHTHIGIASGGKIQDIFNLRTQIWTNGAGAEKLKSLIAKRTITGVAIASVVPFATIGVRRFIRTCGLPTPFVLTAKTVAPIGIDYPNPDSIGPDRLANAIAARAQVGAPVIVVDFGTAVTFDVVNKAGNYVGGIIAPGLAVMTDYLHEKTALLPRIEIRETRAVIGKNTEQAMLSGAVHGYRGMIRELIGKLKKELKAETLPVLATGGYARLMAKGLPEITAVEPLLTLTGLLIASREFRFKVETSRRK